MESTKPSTAKDSEQAKAPGEDMLKDASISSSHPTKQKSDNQHSLAESTTQGLVGARRLYFILSGLVGLACIVLLLGVYVANGLLSNKSKRIQDARLESALLDRKLQQVARARADITKYQDLATIAKDIVPQDKDQAQTVREITRLAESSNIKLGEISFPSSTLGDTKTPHSQLKAVTGIAGVYSLQITVVSDSTAPVSYTDLLKFLDALEHNRRTALVDSISIEPESGKPDKLSFTIILNEYIKP